MPSVTIPGPCPYCDGTQFARLTSVAVALMPTHQPPDASGGLGAEAAALFWSFVRMDTYGVAGARAQDAQDAAYEAKAAAEKVVDASVLFALIMCTTCGKADWFSQNPAYVVERFGEDAKIVSLPAVEPYR